MTDRYILEFCGKPVVLDDETLQKGLDDGTELPHYGTQNAPETLPRWLTADEMAAQTSIPKSWWLEAAKRNEVPSVRKGKYVRFPASILSATDHESAAGSPAKQSVARLAAVQGRSEKQQ